MPNWCENTLNISGNEKDIKKFMEQAKDEDTDLSLNKFVPMPEELESVVSPCKEDPDRMAKYGYNDWYDWSIGEWGTKWDVEAELIYGDEGYLHYTFDSPWSPPIKWLKKVSAMYPDLNFSLKYDEPGMGFMGIAKARNGEVDDRCLEY